ncbi:protein YtxH-like superfamily [Candidatus Termititenax persephonae]|uniref:Protein YtxH-like superfamily n=1 Tax=Candidatus Termititenax persephonae TaxID=2218525 RepID=A0A388THM1_9BACT|nr:protein YtxH-like superfamily [Candidatus Termititenax persephonae]
MRDKEYGHGGMAFLEGILIGAVLGGVLGVLFAPQSGEKTRRWLKDVKAENQDIIDDGVKNVENLVSSAKQVIEDKIRKIEEKLGRKDEKNKKDK